MFKRVLVFFHAVSGPRRPNDVGDCVARGLQEAGLPFLICSTDRENHPSWCLDDPAVSHVLGRLAEEGEIDIAGGGPPCDSILQLQH